MASLRTLKFDFRVALVSIFIEVVAFGIMAVSPSAESFTVGTFIGSFGAGVNPAMQSVAMLLYTRAGGIESGALFGALSVVNALRYWTLFDLQPSTDKTFA